VLPVAVSAPAGRLRKGREPPSGRRLLNAGPFPEAARACATDRQITPG
jgi:hypothetical protein